jgi:SAM-dependent MidA family methyltransferase
MEITLPRQGGGGVPCRAMATPPGLRDELRNLLQYGDLSFRDFVELALYHPAAGYYSRAQNPVGREGDFITAPLLSPAFSFAIAGLIREFLRRHEGEVTSVVDIGCGDGALIHALAAQVPGPRYFGVDRALGRARAGEGVTFVQTFEEVPRDGAHLILSNELFDAFPFARLVQRGEHIHELWIAERDGELDWSEHEAPPVYEDYFASHGIALEPGQFADVSLEWEAFYADLARYVRKGLIVTIDYGFPARKLFHPRIRRFGTAASYSRQRVTRDLLARPGEQDLTAHINFSDLERAGGREGASTVFFDRLNKFLLSLKITDHELFHPVTDLHMDGLQEGVQLLDERDSARRLILPDGIGEDLSVLVQAKGEEDGEWSFQRPLF